MDLQGLTKDLSSAVSKHCELKGGVTIHSEGAKYVQQDELQDCYFEQRIVVSFTRVVRSDDESFGNLADSVLLNKELMGGYSQWNYLHYRIFEECLLKYFEEAELEVRSPGLVYVKLSTIREILSDKLPLAASMLPRELFKFTGMMLDEMKLSHLSEYRNDTIKPYFAIFIDGIKELGVKNTCLDK